MPRPIAKRCPWLRPQRSSQGIEYDQPKAIPEPLPLPTELNMVMPKRIVIATIGSLGDLHPCIALALELSRRGHRVTIASTGHYRAKVEELGIEFHPIRPNWDPTDRDLIRQCEDLK